MEGLQVYELQTGQLAHAGRAGYLLGSLLVLLGKKGIQALCTPYIIYSFIPY